MATTAPPKPARIPESARYEFFEPIGTGGAGTVFRGRDRITGLPVAIKVLKAALTESPQQHYRFAQEFRAATRLEHPNIVRALDFGTDGSLSFLVYDLVDGQSLGDRIEKSGKLPEREAVRFITQIAQALHYAHQRRVIHRDVKPDNILILPDGRAKLTDFGLAKDYDNDQDLTRAASGLGTPYFMAPEQFASAKTADARCDVYSLGATLYNAVTGKLPFVGGWAMAILAKKEARDLVPPKQLAPDLSDRVEAAIRAALEPDPADRPVTCLEFFKRLTARAKFEEDSVFDLEAVGPAGSADRRAWTRHPLDLGTCGTVNTSLHGGKETEESWPLIVRDVSVGGIGLLLARRFETGTELTVELGAGPDGAADRITATVVRLEQAEVGHWIHGCTFAKPITGEELAGLLRIAQPPTRPSSGSGSVPASPASSPGRPAPARPAPPG